MEPNTLLDAFSYVHFVLFSYPNQNWSLIFNVNLYYADCRGKTHPNQRITPKTLTKQHLAFFYKQFAKLILDGKGIKLVLILFWSFMQVFNSKAFHCST